MPTFAIGQRVKVVKQGADLNKVGSIDYLNEGANQAKVVLDDGGDRQSGAMKPPATPEERAAIAKTFTLTEIAPN